MKNGAVGFIEFLSETVAIGINQSVTAIGKKYVLSKNSLDRKPIGFVHCNSPEALPVHRQMDAQPHSINQNNQEPQKEKTGAAMSGQ